MKHSTLLLCIICALIVYYDVKSGSQLYSQIQTLINSFVSKVDFLKNFVDGIYNTVDYIKVLANYIWQLIKDFLLGWLPDSWFD